MKIIFNDIEYPLWACTSLTRLKQAKACFKGYANFLRHVKNTLPSVGDDDPVPLVLACQSNSVADVMWALRNASCGPDSPDCARVLRELACDFAEHVLPIFELLHPGDKRPRQAIEVARRFARGEATDEEHKKARRAAAYAAYAAYAIDTATAAECQWQLMRIADVLSSQSLGVTS